MMWIAKALHHEVAGIQPKAWPDQIHGEVGKFIAIHVGNHDSV